MKRAVKKLLLAASVGLLLAAAYQCLRWAAADILAAQVQYQLDKAQSGELNGQAWRDAEEMLRTVLDLHSDNSEYLALAARFYQTAADQPPSLLAELGWRNQGQQALDYIRRALRIRPGWPYLWSQLVASKIELEQYDVELFGAVERAVSLGPWEKNVQYDIVFLGLNNWDNLQTAAKNSVLKAAEQSLAMERDPKTLQQELQQSTHIDKLCAWPNTTPGHELSRFRQFCSQRHSK